MPSEKNVADDDSTADTTPSADTQSRRGFVLSVEEDGKLEIKRSVLRMASTRNKLKRKVGKSLAHVNKLMLVNPTVQLTAFMEEPDVKILDKLSFMMGVSVICFSEFIFLKNPEWFPLYYQALITLLIIVRAFLYFQNKAQFFLMDFCYAVNGSCIAQTLLQTENVEWFKLNYVFAMGPLCAAIPVWRNSLVFHSLDKITSIFMHGLPAILFHLYRFGKIPSKRLSYHSDDLGFRAVLFYALFFYVLWQAMYTLVTEILFYKTFTKDKSLVTSLRHLARNEWSWVIQAIRQVRLFCGMDEVLDPDETKTKVIFACFQFAFTFLTMLPCPWLYRDERLSAGYLFIIFAIGMWNGASYYFEKSLAGHDKFKAC